MRATRLLKPALKFDPKLCLFHINMERILAQFRFDGESLTIEFFGHTPCVRASAASAKLHGGGINFLSVIVKDSQSWWCAVWDMEADGKTLRPEA